MRLLKDNHDAVDVLEARNRRRCRHASRRKQPAFYASRISALQRCWNGPSISKRAWKFFIYCKTCSMGWSNTGIRRNLRLVGDIMCKAYETGSMSLKHTARTCRVVKASLCPNSITSILLKTCLKPGFRQVLSRKKVGNLVSDKFWAEKKPGLRQVVRQVERLVVRQVVRQDRSNGIWALSGAQISQMWKSGRLGVVCRPVNSVPACPPTTVYTGWAVQAHSGPL